jgi:hypothetical protein
MTTYKFAFTWRGAWAVGTRYSKDDLVSYGGSVWKAKVANLAQTPAAGTYWEIFAEKGAQGLGGLALYDDATDLSSVTGQTDGQLAFVTDLGAFRFSSSSTTTANATHVIAPGVGSGRWVAVANGKGTLPIVDPRSFGAVGDGTTDDTTAIRAAVAYADAIGGGCVVDFSAPPVAWVCRMVTITSGDLVLRGGGARVIQRLDSSCVQIGGGDYTVSAVFLCQRGSQRISIEGFRFEQHAEFDSIAAGYTSTSNFSPIVFHRSDYGHVDHCTFDCRMGRGIQWRGGNYGRLGGGCVFLECGFSAAHGNVTDAYYGDGASDTSTRFSPIGLTVEDGVTFIGSTSNAAGLGPIHLTACDQFSIGAVKLLELNDASREGIRIYAGDFGVTDVDGVVQTIMRGTVKGAQVYGTVAYGIAVLSDSPLGSDVTPRVIIDGITIDVTGYGFYAEGFAEGKLLNSSIRSTTSPIRLSDSCEAAEIAGCRLVCTDEGATQNTLSFGSSAELKGFNFHHNYVEMAADDEYIIRTTGLANDFECASICNNTFGCKSTKTNGRAIQIGAAEKFIRFNDNNFDILAAGLSNRVLMSITASGTLDIEMNNNKWYSSNATSYGARGISINSGRNLSAKGNDVGGWDITVTGDVDLTGSRFVHDVVVITPLKVTNAAFVLAGDIVAEQTATTNTRVIEFTGVAKAKLHHSKVKTASSTSTVILAATSGVLEVDQVDVSNAGAGAPYGITGTGLIGGDLGAYIKDTTQWTDANRLSAAIFRPGTVFWNSSDNAPNYSDGAAWRDAAGAAT